MSLKENYRLHVYLSHSGIASRRKAESYILEGRVSVNGRKVTSLGEKVNLDDIVCFDNERVKIEEKLLYLVLNKPPLYICSSFDPQGRPLALELLPHQGMRLYNIGRLDYRSSGLILFTNDGEFASIVGHPGSGIEKEYVVESTGPIPDHVVEDFLNGIEIAGVYYKAESVLKTGKKTLRVVLIEGKNREIRKVFSHFRLHPKKLTRVRIGPVKIGDLKEGESRPLSGEELIKFRSKTW